MALPAQKLPLATLDDLLNIPESERFHEIIDGELVQKAMPSFQHGQSQAKLSWALDPYHRRPGGRWPGGWWFASETEIFFNEKQTYRPDVAGWRRERLASSPKEFPVKVIPDWVCEVLSLSNSRNDTVRKMRTYQQHKVPHYWIIDPLEETLTIFRWTSEGYLLVITAERGERIRPEPFTEIDLYVGVLFGDDDPALE